MCCGPCSCYPVKKLREEGIEPVGYFFNPNIHPYKEWDMRLKTAKEFSEKVGMEFHADEHYRLRDFLKKALPAEALPNGRCQMCYTWRLEETARYAAAISEARDTIEDVYEPYLIQLGFINRTPRGRVVTEAGYRHLGIPYPEK